MTGETTDTQAQAAAQTDTAENLLTIEFAGMVSFVKRPETVYGLLVAPHRSSVKRPGLCRHYPYLVFPVDRETFEGVESGSFYTSFLGADGKPYGLWNIDGFDFEILPGGERNHELKTVSPEDSFREKVLDLDPFAKSPVHPWWLGQDAVEDRGFLASRFQLKYGILESARTSANPWVMRTQEQGLQGVNDRLRNLAREQHEVVVYRIQSEHEYVRLEAKNAQGDVRFLKLKRGASVQVSNLCPVKPGNLGIERDVMAFYDLCTNPLPQEDRQYPHTIRSLSGQVSLGTTACPPIQQTGGGD